jgi:hypothetical protein
MWQSVLANIAFSASVRPESDLHKAFRFLATCGDDAVTVKASLRSFFLVSGLVHDNACLPSLSTVDVINLYESAKLREHFSQNCICLNLGLEQQSVSQESASTSLEL